MPILQRCRSLSNECQLHSFKLARKNRSQSADSYLNKLTNLKKSEESKEIKKNRFKNLQEFLRNVAVDLEHIILESKSRIEDFKLDVFNSYNYDLSQMTKWFTFLSLFMDGINENINFQKYKILSESIKIKNEYDIFLLSTFKHDKSRKEIKTEKDERSPDVSPSISPLKNSLNLSNGKQNESEQKIIEVQKIISENQSIKFNQERNINHVKTCLNQEKVNFLDGSEIFKELEKSEKERKKEYGKSDKNSTGTDSTEIYDEEFFIAQEKKLREGNLAIPDSKLDISDKIVNINITLSDSQTSSNTNCSMEYPENDSSSFIFDISQNLQQIVKEEEIILNEEQDLNCSTESFNHSISSTDMKNIADKNKNNEKAFDSTTLTVENNSLVNISKTVVKNEIEINECILNEEENVEKDKEKCYESDVDVKNVKIKSENESLSESTEEFCSDNYLSSSESNDDTNLKRAFEVLKNENFFSDTDVDESVNNYNSTESLSEETDSNETILKDESESENLIKSELFSSSQEITMNDEDPTNKNSITTENEAEKIPEEMKSCEASTFRKKECSVILHRLSKEQINKILDSKNEQVDYEEAELKRLLNLKSLDRKRKLSNSDEEQMNKRKKTTSNIKSRPKIVESKESDSSSGDDVFFESDDEKDSLLLPLNSVYSESNRFDSDDWSEDEDKENKLTSIARCEIDSSSDSSTSEEENEEKNKKTKSEVKTATSNAENKNENKKTNENSYWRKDSLLNKRFESETSDSSDTEKTLSKVSNLKMEMNDNSADLSENKINTSEKKRNLSFSSDEKKSSKIKNKGSYESSDFELLKIPFKALRTSAIILSSSSSNSDIELISNSLTRKKKFSKKKSSNSSSDIELTEVKKKGRKNIRAIIDDETLEESTKRAIEEEKRRRERVNQKQKLMVDFLSQSTDTFEETGLILDIDHESNKPLVVVNSELTNRLKDHQKDGVKFMWTACYESVEQIKNGDNGSGCILAHCMGLGKTFQVITLIHTLLAHSVTKTKHVLIVCPLSTVLNWDDEFNIAFRIVKNIKKINVFLIGDQLRTPQKKSAEIKLWYDNGGVLIMGYEAYTNLVKSEKLSEGLLNSNKKALIDPGPDLVILDEGHLLKNGKNLRTTSLMKIKTKRRIILTGTPMQNNLTEYYHMVNFVKPHFLGSYLEFCNRFANPIQNGQYDDSTKEDVRKMKYSSHVLHNNLKRTIQRYEVAELESYLPQKLDYVLFIQLHSVQISLYKEFIKKLSEIEKLQTKRIFAHYKYLQNIWTHPRLLNEHKKSTQNKKFKEIDTIELDDPVENEQDEISDWWSPLCPSDIDTNLDYGPKFKVMLSIIDESIECRDKVLIFSNSLGTLDCIETFLQMHGTPSHKSWKLNYDYYRMDGTIKPEYRMKLCKSFNNKKNTQVKVFLVSHKVGGLGLNLVAANRVILMDVNWNPSYDSQSIFRIYRFGQTKPCYIYRLVSMGTMEEVVYERCITKLAISGRVVDERQISRHFRSDELLKMYRANFILNQSRPQLNVPEDKILGKVYRKHTEEFFKYLSHQALLENLPHESLTKEEMEKAWEEFGKETETKKTDQVKKAWEANKKELNERRYQKNLQTIDNLATQTLFYNNVSATAGMNQNFSRNFPINGESSISNSRIVPSSSISRNTTSHFEEVYIPSATFTDKNDQHSNGCLIQNNYSLTNEKFENQSRNNIKNCNSNTLYGDLNSTKVKKGNFLNPASASSVSVSATINLENNETPELQNLQKKRTFCETSTLNKNSHLINSNNISNRSNLKTRTKKNIIKQQVMNQVPIDVEQQDLLSQLAKKQDISFSPISKHKDFNSSVIILE